MRFFRMDMKRNLKTIGSAVVVNLVLFGVLTTCYNLQKLPIIRLFDLLYTLPEEVLNFIGLGKKTSVSSVDLFLTIFMPFFHMLSFSFVGKICRNGIFAWEEDRQQLYYFTQPMHRARIWFQKVAAAVVSLISYQVCSMGIYLVLTYVFNVHIRRMFFKLEVVPRALQLFVGSLIVELGVLLVLFLAFSIVQYEKNAKTIGFYFFAGSFVVGWSGMILAFVNYVANMITGKSYVFLNDCAAIAGKAKYVSCFYWAQFCQEQWLSIGNYLLVGGMVVLFVCTGFFVYNRRETVSV